MMIIIIIIIILQWTVIKARFHLGSATAIIRNVKTTNALRGMNTDLMWPCGGWHDVKNHLPSNPISTSSSNWILTSCQPHRVTSGLSNSGHKQIHISETLLTYVSTLCQVNLQNQSLRKHKKCIHKHQTQIFEELVPLLLPLLKEHTRLVYPVTPFSRP